MTGKIFVSYRRADAAGSAGRLFDALETIFPPPQLFMDVYSIDGGRNFLDEIARQIALSDVMIVVIGKHWLARDPTTNRRRLDEADDIVRMEIEAALSEKTVIPVLVDGAEMPSPKDVPATIAPLCFRNAVRISHENFRQDTNRLVGVIRGALEAAELARLPDKENNQSEAMHLARYLAHTLRRPLTNIVGFTHLVTSGAVPQDKFREYAHHVESSAVEILRLLNSIMEDDTAGPKAG